MMRVVARIIVVPLRSLFVFNQHFFWVGKYKRYFIYDTS